MVQLSMTPSEIKAKWLRKSTCRLEVAMLKMDEAERILCLGTSLFESLHGSVLGVTLVSHKLGVNTTQGWVLVGLRLLDTVSVSLGDLVVLRRVL